MQSSIRLFDLPHCAICTTEGSHRPLHLLQIEEASLFAFDRQWGYSALLKSSVTFAHLHLI